MVKNLVMLSIIGFGVPPLEEYKLRSGGRQLPEWDFNERKKMNMFDMPQARDDH